MYSEALLCTVVSFRFVDTCTRVLFNKTSFELLFINYYLFID